MNRPFALMLLPPIALAGCTVPQTAAPVRTGGMAPVPVPYTSVGLERVLGQDAAGLTKLFGTADADVREGTARKLQYQGRFCVLDAYLYPKDGAEPRVTYIDAREPDGSAIDRASCVAALTRRDGGR
ncbi:MULTISPECIES: hypothetical protein [unclassified Sphingomonas]|uniref:hypothetical protein n=1 Tax=unclassified Sphingomonas TaxID=196159 RepID=UPI0028577077|nr:MULTISPECIES: hypothetical protein [unclassified Sphingomonas]MDR6113566.1 hypothetical protein [Sphingomonas sp. SORGH_AS_0789]MDR6149073.1 hypothetical protein [Sphingomonas sp. SORGH_AS_0742]